MLQVSVPHFGTEQIPVVEALTTLVRQQKPDLLLLSCLARPVWAVQAGTAVSSRVREGLPDSVNLLHWGRRASLGCCRVEQWDFHAEPRAFVRVKVTEVRPVRA